MSPSRPQMHTIGSLIEKSAAWLSRHGVDTPRLDAELLLCHVTGTDRLGLYMEWQKPLTELEVAAYRDLIRRRGQDRVPVARLVGKKDFYGRAFEVTDQTFVPRAETEGLVERALAALENEPALQTDRPRVFDVCTGSGCIVVTLAAENGEPQYFASEISEEALATARKNARTHHVEQRIEFRRADLFDGFEGSLHLVVSNPPYIMSGVIPTLDPEVKTHDPMRALDGGAEGMDVIRRLLGGAAERLVAGGVILLEIGEDQEELILRAFEEAGAFTGMRIDRDEAGLPRYAFARRKASGVLRDAGDQG